MLKLFDIIRANRRLARFIKKSPLIYSEALSERSGANVWLKLECIQPTGSFKIRGALHKLLALDDEQLARGVVTASAGNHGLGVAYSARALGLKNVTIFVPTTTPAAKIAKLSRYPANLHQIGQSFDQAQHAALDFCQKNGAAFVSGYDDAQLIAGAGTCGLEIVTEQTGVDAVIVPVGGGGLVAGTAVAVKGVNPGCRIIGVQPEASPSAKLSFEQNLPLETYEHAPTIADGLAGGFGAHPFYIARTLIDDILLYSEADLRQAIFRLVDMHQLVVEASGAIAICPLLVESERFSGKNVVCVLTGSNIDTALLSEILREYTEIPAKI